MGSMSAAPIFRSDLQERVLYEVFEDSGARTASDIARQIGAPVSTVSRETARLVDSGMLNARAQGRKLLLSPNLRNPFTRAVMGAFEHTETVDAARRETVRSWQTIDEIAANMRAQLDRGDESMALRLLLDGINRAPVVADLGRLDEMLAEPESTGDTRWDTLLAASVQYVSRRLGDTPPRWSRKPTLPTWWWPAQESSLAARTVARTPIDFKRVGIWFDEQNFATA